MKFNGHRLKTNTASSPASHLTNPFDAMNHLITLCVICLTLPIFVLSAATSHSSQSVAQQPLPPAPIWPDGLYTQSSYYYADYKIPHPPPKKFLPDPPSCPETGRTVCQKVDKYPSDEVFQVIRAATSRSSKSFNFSSVFMDESENDEEPKFKKPKPVYAKPTGKAYIVYQAALPVVPISYVNQHNNGYARNNEGQNYNGQRQPTHRIVFPTQQTSAFQPPNSYKQSYSPAQLYRETVPPRQQQQEPPKQLPAPVSYETITQHGPQNQQHMTYANRDPRYEQKTPDADYKQPNYFPPATSDTNYESNAQYQQPSAGSGKTSSNWRPYFPSPPGEGPQEGSEYPQADGTEDPYSLQGFHPVQEKLPMNRKKRQAGDDEEIEDICRTQKQFISPRAALNDRAQWKYIVNIGDRDPRLRQVIKVDVCSNANEPCSNQITLPFGFVSRCKQKYIKKKLLSLDPDGQGTSSENFFVPSCCVCEIVRVNSKKKK